MTEYTLDQKVSFIKVSMYWELIYAAQQFYQF